MKPAGLSLSPKEKSQPVLKVAICCREGDPFQGPRGVLVSDLEMNYPRRCVCRQSERLYWEGRPGQRAAGEGAQEDCSATWPQLYCGNGANFWAVSGQSLCLAHIWSDSGSLLMGPPVVRQLMSKLSLCLAKVDGFSQPFPNRPVGLRCFSL